MIFDAPPFGRQFGSVLRDVIEDEPYTANDLVSAQFVGANPRVRYSWFAPSAERIDPFFSFRRII